MDVIGGNKQALGEILFPKVSSLEPALARKITDMILEMTQIDIIRLIGDDDALRAQVQRSKDAILQSSVAKNDENCDSDDEHISTPTSSDEERENAAAELSFLMTTQNTQAEGEDEPRSGLESNIPFLSSVTTGSQDRHATTHAESSRDEAGLAESIRTPADPDTMEEVVASSTMLSRDGTSIGSARGSSQQARARVARSRLEPVGASEHPLAGDDAIGRGH
ncbi:hypothetical protein J7T55_003111 [Diaporthe amygdali]|uniref:uncharacterized protein n=1 Tax=Phomopsis amygdali TaxID=1214568 RepID=UPI0022FEF6E0|nr:uncharacterized protein J7T55_003111 [Diaporthe amygdali]KAJ0122597.1 hypothetical protein J7T55_003111 [Diaporthe amygdali]